jgi:3-deoxy-D-manno-octulosonate 8-phosphate phosphatase (KDO 8-P phosphatase)
MLSMPEITINDIDAFVFDFDGVLTNNLVHLDQDGRELVSCCRGDGLAFDVLRKLNKPAFILSTEKNPVVSARAEKLKIPALQGVENKVDSIKMLSARENFDLSKLLYFGNDLNDFRVMQLCGYTACPSDSHEAIKGIANFVCDTKGGKGVVRELLENILKLDFVQILYPY